MGVASYCEVERFWPLNTALFVENFLENDPRFMHYLFKVTDLTGFNSGSVQPMLNRNYIRNVSVRVPEPSEQRLIAATLGALDDKIAVNERLAGTARLLAQSRFMAAVEDGQAVELELASVAEFISRGIAPHYTDDPRQLIVLNQKCVRDGRAALAPSRHTLTSFVTQQKVLMPNDILVNSTGTGTLGRVALWLDDLPATVDSHVTIVRIDPGKADPVCAGFAMLGAQTLIESLGEGSTGQTELSRTKLGALTLRIPDKDDARQLRPLLDTLEARGTAAVDESATLAALRDTLLPRLLSGEIRVREAERVLGEVT
jgi:type I restriction enzyme S subunit